MYSKQRAVRATAVASSVPPPSHAKRVKDVLDNYWAYHQWRRAARSILTGTLIESRFLAIIRIGLKWKNGIVPSLQTSVVTVSEPKPKTAFFKENRRIPKPRFWRPQFRFQPKKNKFQCIAIFRAFRPILIMRLDAAGKSWRFSNKIIQPKRSRRNVVHEMTAEQKPWETQVEASRISTVLIGPASSLWHLQPWWNPGHYPPRTESPLWPIA